VKAGDCHMRRLRRACRNTTALPVPAGGGGKDAWMTRATMSEDLRVACGCRGMYGEETRRAAATAPTGSGACALRLARCSILHGVFCLPCRTGMGLPMRRLRHFAVLRLLCLICVGPHTHCTQRGGEKKEEEEEEEEGLPYATLPLYLPLPTFWRGWRWRACLAIAS